MGEYAIDTTHYLEPAPRSEKPVIQRMWIELNSEKRIVTLSKLFNDRDMSFLAGYVSRKFNDSTLEVEYTRVRSIKVAEITAVSPRTGKKYVFRSIAPFYDFRVMEA